MASKELNVVIKANTSNANRALMQFNNTLKLLGKSYDEVKKNGVGLDKVIARIGKATEKVSKTTKQSTKANTELKTSIVEVNKIIKVQKQAFVDFNNVGKSHNRFLLESAVYWARMSSEIQATNKVLGYSIKQYDQLSKYTSF